jgi:plastocyanin
MGLEDLAVFLPFDLSVASTGDAATSASVDIMDDFYAPRNVTITRGGSITWTWRGSNTHSVTSDNGSELDSMLQSSGSYSHVFTQAGSYPYHCRNHGQAMAGIISVQ